MFTLPSYYARELKREEVPQLQALFEANPEYFLATNGHGPKDDEARREFEDLPPAHLGFTQRWVTGLFDRDDELVGIATIVSDLCAAQVWHIGLFLTATSLHGQGVGSELFAALEDWMLRSGARWLRLGVVEGSARAERFWFRQGFQQVRMRHDIDTGGRLNNIRVLVKPLQDSDLHDYLARVPRDQPNSLLP